MAFENLTLFEVSLDGAQIGPRSLGRRDEVDPAHSDAEDARGRGWMAGFLVIALVTAGAALRWRRARVAGVDVESADAEAELAAEQ